MPADFESVSPVIPVSDLDAALERYRRLGFDATAYDGPERYGFAERGSVSLHLTEARVVEGAVVYLYVSDADAVRAEWEAAGVEGRITRATDAPYGLREFGYVDPDGTLLRVGSPLPAAETAALSPTPLLAPEDLAGSPRGGLSLEAPHDVVGWCEDPWGRHQHRWYTDGAPTKLVRDQGVEAYDEPPSGDPPSAPVAVAEDPPATGGDDLVRAGGEETGSPGQLPIETVDIHPIQ